MANISQLCFEFHLHRYLLEQSSSPLAYVQAGQWPHSLGKYASAFLAILDPFHYGVDGREQFCKAAHRDIWGGAFHACTGLLHSSARHIEKRGINPGQGNW